MKTATILDEDNGAFGLEYDNNRGTRNTMRLDATTYARALLEARSFLGIRADDCDADGDLWQVE